MALGHFIIGTSHLVSGDFSSAIESFQEGIQISADPFYSEIPRTGLGIAYAYNGQFQEAEEALQEVVNYSKSFGVEGLGTPAYAMLGAVSVAKGRMSQGLEMIEYALRTSWENEKKWFYAVGEAVLGRIHLQIVQGEGERTLSSMAKNIGFLLKTVPFADKKAESHFRKAIEVSKEIGAKGTLAQVYLNLGLLHKTKKRMDKARDCISEAIKLFEKCEADVFLKQAKEALASLE
jgi:tetratricopeptide (TPR) repeat protein